MEYILLSENDEQRLELDAELRAPLTEPVLGWVRKPHGWCRGDACIPAARVAERYNVINVPTVVWIDEEGRIARPQDTQTATDLFRSMNGIDSEASLAALRRWAIDGDRGLTDAQIEENLRVPTRDEQRARAHARLATWLARRDRAEAANRHIAKAAELAPHDVTIRRGLMPLTGVDPFGEAYFALREELEAREIPIYRPLNA